MSALDDLQRLEHVWPTFAHALQDFATELGGNHYFGKPLREAIGTKLNVACGEIYAAEHKRLRLAARLEAEQTLAALKDEAADGG